MPVHGGSTKHQVLDEQFGPHNCSASDSAIRSGRQVDAAYCDAYCHSLVVIEGAACSPSQAASAAGVLQALSSSAQAGWHAGGQAQLRLGHPLRSGSGPAERRAGHRSASRPREAIWPALLQACHVFSEQVALLLVAPAYVLPLGQTTFASTGALYPGVTTAGACQASYSISLGQGAKLTCTRTGITARRPSCLQQAAAAFPARQAMTAACLHTALCGSWVTSHLG